MAVAVRSDAQSTEASGTSVVVPKPSGLTAGDLMVAHITARTNVTVTNPGSWTTIRSETISGVLTSHLAWKIADAGDAAASNFTFTLSGSAVNLGSITAFTGHHTSSPIGANNGTATGSNSTTCSSAAITPAGANSMICFFATMGGSNGDAQIGSYTCATSPPTFVEQYEAYTELGNDITYSMACGVRAAATSTGTGTATLELSRNNIGQMIAITIAASGTTISIPKGEITVTPRAPTIATTAHVRVAPPAGQITVTPRAPTVKLNTIIAPPKGEITVTPRAPAAIVVTANVFIGIPKGEITVTPQAPAVATTANVKILPPAGQIQVTPLAPDIIAANDVVVTVAKGEITVTPQAPTIFVLDPKVAAPPKGEIAVTPYAPALNFKIAMPKGSINVAAYSPTIETTGPKTVLPPRGQIIVTAYAPRVSRGGSGSSGLLMMGIGS